MVGNFVAKLSPEARYFRFEKQFSQPTDSLIHFLTDVDPSRHIALVCTTVHDGHEEEIGEARFVKYPGGKTCEFAIAVANAWQGTGVAGRLMGAIEQSARDQGVEIMEGFVLRANRKMLQFVVARGFTIVPDPEDPHTVRVVKRLK